MIIITIMLTVSEAKSFVLRISVSYNSQVSFGQYTDCPSPSPFNNSHIHLPWTYFIQPLVGRTLFFPKIILILVCDLHLDIRDAPFK